MVTFEGKKLEAKGRLAVTWGTVRFWSDAQRAYWVTNPNTAPKSEGSLHRFMSEDTARQNMGGDLILVKLENGAWIRA